MNKKMYYFSSTHWDREWYRSAQEFRYLLVNVVDEILDCLEQNEDFSVFHFDGQTVVLEDYLEVNPQNYLRLKNLILSNRLKVGPWYCMPDEFLVSGEALIRNLSRGHQIAKSFGGDSWKVGYVCDIFGHIAQMPQIFAGFNIHNAMVFRGAGENSTEPFFKWVSPDGTEAITYKIKDKYGYGSFAIEVCGLKARGKEAAADSEEFSQNAKEYVSKEIGRTAIPYAVLMDGMDHEPIHTQTPRYIERIQELFPSDTVVHEDIMNMFEELESYKDELQTKHGELYESAVEKNDGPNFVITHTLSSRMRLKQRNDFCQSLLEKYLEPLFVYMKATGKTYNDSFADIAWKYLLQNHPHDSICGCSIDSVHKDMEYRFSQVEGICEAVKRDSEKMLSDGLKRCGKVGGFLTFLSTHGKEFQGVIEADIPFVVDFPECREPFGYQSVHAFRLYDRNGNEIKYSIKKMKTNQKVLPFSDVTLPANIYTVAFTGTILPFGQTSFKIVPSDKPVRFYGSMLKSTTSFGNKNIHVDINDNGTINLFDFKTNRAYSGLIDFVDDGEIGDGWHSVRPKCDRVISTGKLIAVEILTDDPEFCQIKIIKEMIIPLQMDYTDTGIRRSAQTAILPIEIILSLGIDDKLIHVKVQLNNMASGHRLRMVLPVATDKQTYEVNQAFTFIERKCGKNPISHDYLEMDQLEKAMGGIAVKRNTDNSGLAFVGRYGFYECGADPLEGNNLYITMLRSFDRVYYSNEIKDGKEFGDISYEFNLMPVNSNVSNTNIQQIADDLKSPITSFITEFDQTKSILSVLGNVNISSVKLANDKSGDTIIRLYNPTNTAEKAKITLALPIEKAGIVNLAEEFISDIKTDANNIELSVGAMKIISVRMECAGEH